MKRGKDNNYSNSVCTWIYKAPNFTTVSCPKLDAPKYGQVWLTGNSYSSTAYYRCNYGYELDGSHSRKCQHDGTWYGKAPECRPVKRSNFFVTISYSNSSHIITLFAVNCRRLDAPKYGKVIMTGYSYLSRAYYSCNYGYELDGAYSRKCQHDGTWYGKAPECRRSKRGRIMSNINSVCIKIYRHDASIQFPYS